MKLLLLLLPFSLIASTTINAKTNVIFIVADDLKPELSTFGSPLPTPNLDKLAEQGTSFSKAYCQLAQCTQSRVSVLTGKRPDTTRVWQLHDKMRALNPGILTLPEHYKNNGYTTASIGKIFDPRSVKNRQKSDEPSWTIPWLPSWKLDYNKSTGKPTAFYQNPETKALIKGHPGYSELKKTLVENEAWMPYESEDVPDDAYSDGAIANQAIKYLKEFSSNDEAFFLAVGFKRPHLPFVAPKKYWDLIESPEKHIAEFQSQSKDGPQISYHTFGELRTYSKTPTSGPVPMDLQIKLVHGYLACTAYIDAQVGKIIDSLEALDLADNTLIVFWGDHGFHLGDHGLWCKHSNFEQATRVPLIIKAPNGIKNNPHSTPVELIDLFPTLCDLSGIEKPAGLDGVSLSKVVNKGAKNKKGFAISQYLRGKNMGYSIRNDRYRYTEWLNGSKDRNNPIAIELYDYKNDPMETTNLSGLEKHQKTIQQMKDDLHSVL